MKNKSEKLKAISYKLKASKGFTLVEVLIVVAIVGALVSIVAVRASNSLNEAKVAACWSNISAIQSAAASYYSVNTSWPSVSTLVSSYYLEVSPTCPVQNVTYNLTTSGNYAGLVDTISTTGTTYDHRHDAETVKSYPFTNTN